MTQAGFEDPFVLRGHHINTLTPLVFPMSKNPEHMAGDLRRSSTSDRGESTAETIDWSVLASQKGGDEYWATYAYDLVGETEAQADVFEGSYSAFLIAFVALADNATVRLTAKGMDGMCGSCTFRMHCQGSEEAKADGDYMDVFEDVLAYAKSKDSALDVPATRTDEGDILTTAQAVRRVIAHFAISKLWQNDLYDDALQRRKAFGNVFAGPDKSKIETYYEAYGHEINGGLTPTEPSPLPLTKGQ